VTPITTATTPRAIAPLIKLPPILDILLAVFSLPF
jgi:hypothetical protein